MRGRLSDQRKQKPTATDSSKDISCRAHRAVDISPTSFPVLVNGGFLQNQASKIKDPIRAKSLVLDDGTTRLAIVVVDTCMMPRELIDRAKNLAREKTGIRTRSNARFSHAYSFGSRGDGCPGLSCR